MENLKKIISLHQASIISGYHQDYLGSLLRKNEIKGEKLGGNWFTTEEEIKNYIFKQKIRHKKWIVKYFLSFTRRINKSFVYALICLILFSVGLYVYNKVEIKNPEVRMQFSGINQPKPNEQFNRLQF